MDNKFIRFYNQNRQLFWVIVATIISVIILIHILNNFIRNKNIEQNNVMANQETITSTKDENYSVISGKKIDSEKANIIRAFLNYCNNGNIENAYELLSDDCKEILYPDVESFKDTYYNKIFNTKKTYSYQAMQKNSNLYTYQINFTEDMLKTGKTSKTSIVDYYTVVDKNQESKLNINKLIKKEELNSSCNTQNIEAKLEYKIVYYDYEIYSINFKNSNITKVILDDFKSPKNIFLKDEKNNTYLWCNYEYIEDELILQRGIEKNLLIKFSKEYKPSMEAKKIVFQKVIINEKEEIRIEIDIL